jgi:hypothetical protein
MNDTRTTGVPRQRLLFDRTSFPAPLSADRLYEIEQDGWEPSRVVRGPDGCPLEYEFIRRADGPAATST